MKAIQKFSDEYLEYCRTLSPAHIVQFLEDFRQLQSQSAPQKTRLISMRVPEALLRAFQQKAKSQGVPYQAQIKRLMREWLG